MEPSRGISGLMPSRDFPRRRSPQPGPGCSARLFGVLSPPASERAQRHAANPLAGAMAATILGLSPLSHAAPATETTPGNDFYTYANAAWLASASVPQGRSSIDTFYELRVRAAERVREIIERSGDSTLQPREDAERPLIRLIGTYYNAYRRRPHATTDGLRDLAAEVAAIEGITNSSDLAHVLGRRLYLDDGTNTSTDTVIGLWVHQGFHDAAHDVVHLMQGGLGLADRDDYLDAAPLHEDHRTRYLTALARLFTLVDEPGAAARAARVMRLETEIARTHASRADTDDVIKTDNTWRRADINSLAPGFDWDAFLSAAGLDHAAELTVWQPTALRGLAALVASQPLEDWKDYLWVRLIEHYGATLSTPFATAVAEVRNSAPAPALGTDLDRAAILATDAALGPAVGELYRNRYFSEHARAKARAMAENLRAALRGRLIHSRWMTPATRERALLKLDRMVIGIGFADKRADYSGLTLDEERPVINQQRSDAFAYAQALAKLRRAHDDADWQLVPQHVSALINLSPNSFEFTAALLDEPLFAPDGDLAANYGSAGAGMAHELWHSFDDVGHLYDESGRLAEQWTPGDRAALLAAEAPLVAQLGHYCTTGSCLDGERVRSESAADLVGLLAAYDAYHRALRGKADAVIGGLTGDQRFFLAFAHRWRRVETPEAERKSFETDTHAPPAWRAAIVRNVDAWYSAFQIKKTDRLFLPVQERVRLP